MKLFKIKANRNPDADTVVLKAVGRPLLDEVLAQMGMPDLKVVRGGAYFLVFIPKTWETKATVICEETEKTVRAAMVTMLAEVDALLEDGDFGPVESFPMVSGPKGEWS